MAQPVVVLAVLFDGSLDTGRQRDFEITFDDIRRAFDDPRQNGTARIPEQVIAVVFDVALAFDLRVEGNHDQPPPRTISTDLQPNLSASTLQRMSVLARSLMRR